MIHQCESRLLEGNGNVHRKSDIRVDIDASMQELHPLRIGCSIRQTQCLIILARNPNGGESAPAAGICIGPPRRSIDGYGLLSGIGVASQIRMDPSRPLEASSLPSGLNTG